MQDCVARTEIRQRLLRIHTGYVELEKESIEQIDSSGDPDGSLRLQITQAQGAQRALKTFAEQLGIGLMDRGNPE